MILTLVIPDAIHIEDDYQYLCNLISFAALPIINWKETAYER